jgi:thiol-disulfide isomerase/thioredoxin
MATRGARVHIVTALVVGFVPLEACVPHLESGGASETITGDSWERPANTWGTEEDEGPPPGLSSEGFEDGNVAPDLRLVDQHGDEVSLWQFYGDVIVLDVSTIWCAPCRALAEHTQETVNTFGDEGLSYVTVLQQDLEGDPPDDADLDLWASTYGISAPILADGAAFPQTSDAYGRVGSYPAVLLIGRDMRVLKVVAPVDSTVLDAAIEEAL